MYQSALNSQSHKITRVRTSFISLAQKYCIFSKNILTESAFKYNSVILRDCLLNVVLISVITLDSLDSE